MRIAGEPDRPHSTAESASAFGISRHHLAKPMAALAAAGFIETRRGTGGGAVLARPAEEIRIGAVVRELEAGQALVACFQRRAGGCVITPSCRLKGMLASAETAFLDQLDTFTLAECALEPAALQGLNPVPEGSR